MCVQFDATSNEFFYQLIARIIIVTASFCNNICTFFILGTSLESLSGLCQEDVAILGKKKKKKKSDWEGTLQESSNRTIVGEVVENE